MSKKHLYQVLRAPVVSEKAYSVADIANQIVFKVAVDANKKQIKSAVEKFFNVNVEAVRVLNVKGKTRRTRSGLGKQSNWKKAYVRLAEGQDIDFAAVD
jgi:large subunit ribosomal protein L23